MTRRLVEMDHRHVWHPFTQMRDWMHDDDPVVIAAGKGAVLRDVNGNEYLDANSSIWTNLHGHQHPVITGAIKAQLDKIAHSSFLGLSNEPAIELAEQLVGLASRLTQASGGERRLTRVFYSDDGSTAMEAAIKMAVQYWRQRGMPARTKFVTFAEAYHGDTMGAVSVGGIDLFHATFKPLTFDVARVKNVAEMRDVLASHRGQVAGVCIEPLVQGAAGMRMWPRGLLGELRALCDAEKTLLIADEVMTGFGRTGTMFACEQEGVVPDLMALAKGLTGGYLPLAATIATEEIFDAFLGEYAEFKTFFHGHSYTGNQLGCAAALASLRVFDEERTLERVRRLGDRMACELEACSRLPGVLDVRRCGLIGAVELGPYPVTNRMGINVCAAMRRRGVLTRPIGNVVVVMPPYCISDDQLSAIFAALAAGIKEVCGCR
jgi:adenosylmethionine-8-amino-7-oxononanoate aminotransferase